MVMNNELFRERFLKAHEIKKRALITLGMLEILSLEISLENKLHMDTHIQCL